MKKFCAFIATTLMLVACSKNKDTVQDPGKFPSNAIRVKTRTSGANMNTYAYDGLGRLTQISRSDGSKFVYEYSAGKATGKNYNTSGVYQYSDIEELNADGYTTRTTRSNNPTYEGLYFYNPDKTLAKQILKYNNTTSIFDYFWSNGNLDSTRIQDGNGNLNYTSVQTYYTDKPARLGDDEFGEQLWGKGSKNLQKSYYNRFPDGSKSDENIYTYEYDPQGRVIKRTTTVTNSNSIYITLYTY